MSLPGQPGALQGISGILPGKKYMSLGPALERHQVTTGDGEMGWGGGCWAIVLHGRGIALTGWDPRFAGHRQPGKDPH